MGRLVLVTVVCGLSIYGCAAYHGKPNEVILKHPVTQEFVDCKVDKWQSEKSYQANEKCVKEYEAQGYVIWNSR